MLRECAAALVCCYALGSAAQTTAALTGLQQTIARVSSPIALPDAPSFIEARLKSDKQDFQPIHEVLASDPYQPLTTKQKWNHFLRRSLSSPTYLGDAEDTAFTWMTGGFMYCCGIGAWGKQYGASLADGESRTFFGNFLLPTLLRQDPRYFPKRKGTIRGRAWYAATRIFVARNDSSKSTVNFSELGGVALSKALSNAYYPDGDRGGWATTYNILGKLQSDVTSNELREFWPEIREIVHKHTPKCLRGLEDRLPLPGPSSQY